MCTITPSLSRFLSFGSECQIQILYTSEAWETFIKGHSWVERQGTASPSEGPRSPPSPQPCPSSPLSRLLTAGLAVPGCVGRDVGLCHIPCHRGSSRLGPVQSVSTLCPATVPLPGEERSGTGAAGREAGGWHLTSPCLLWTRQVSAPWASLLTLPTAAPPKWPKINSVWRMEMSLWPTGESFSEIGFKLHYTSNFMGT